tara:strand:+ start:170 stop:511 length:342 start_codon:yes stop_codon:yes gene_type:complete
MTKLIAFLETLALRANQLMEPVLTSKAKLIKIVLKRPDDKQMDILEANLDMEFEDNGKSFYVSVKRAGSTYETFNPQGMPVVKQRRVNTASFIETSGCNADDISAKIKALATS